MQTFHPLIIAYISIVRGQNINFPSPGSPEYFAYLNAVGYDFNSPDPNYDPNYDPRPAGPQINPNTGYPILFTPPQDLPETEVRSSGLGDPLGQISLSSTNSPGGYLSPINLGSNLGAPIAPSIPLSSQNSPANRPFPPPFSNPQQIPNTPDIIIYSPMTKSQLKFNSATKVKDAAAAVGRDPKMQNQYLIDPNALLDPKFDFKKAGKPDFSGFLDAIIWNLPNSWKPEWLRKGETYTYYPELNKPP